MVRIVTSFFALALAAGAHAATTGHTVNVNIDSYNSIFVSGSPNLWLSPMNGMPNWEASDSMSWLDYDFVSGMMGDIYVNADMIPSGVSMEVWATMPGGMTGNCGMGNMVYLGGNGMPSGGFIVSGIQNGYDCMTSLTYRAWVQDFGMLQPGNHMVNVTYTTSAP